MTDQFIIAQLKLGNHAVFAQLYQHYNLVENYILKNNGDSEAAKDIFQNALIIFYKKAISPDFELSSKISTYLYGVSQNLWLKNLRKEKFQKIDVAEVQLHTDDAFETENKTPQTPLLEYLKNKLTELGEPCLSIVLMHSYQKLTMHAIAEKLGYANEHTARQQKYKCLQRIRKMIPENEKELYLSE